MILSFNLMTKMSHPNHDDFTEAYQLHKSRFTKISKAALTLTPLKQTMTINTWKNIELLHFPLKTRNKSNKQEIEIIIQIFVIFSRILLSTWWERKNGFPRFSIFSYASDWKKFEAEKSFTNISKFRNEQSFCVF